jgi:pilus assembly protein CpaB
MADDKLRDPLRRTRRWAKVWMAAALLTGLCATVMVARVIKHARPKAALVETVPVVVASAPLPMATSIVAGQLRIVQWPKEALPKGTFSKVEDLAGRVAKERILEGEPIVLARLASKEAGAGLTAIIPEDMRAMSVKVNEVIGVAGFIHPNDRVDVIAVMAANDASTNPTDRLPRAKVILQNIQVLAVGEEMVDESKGQKTQPVNVVTLLVMPEDAERLALAAEEGHIRLAMRNPIDQFEVETAGIIPPGLMVESAPAPGTAPAGERVVRYVRRTERREPAAPQQPVADPVSVVEVFHGKKLEERKIHPAGETETGQPTPNR